MASIDEFAVKDIRGQATTLAPYAGTVRLIVNVASACGFTPQYAGLESLYGTYKDRGFVVLGFPCNQFGGQEPGTEAEIQTFCETRFHVTFPMFAKIDVNGDAAHPLFQYLKSSKPGLLGRQAITWNFTKFLVDRNGAVVARFASLTSPRAIEKHVVRLLG